MTDNIINFTAHIDKRTIGKQSNGKQLSEEEVAIYIYNIARTQGEINQILYEASTYVSETKDPKIMLRRLTDFKNMLTGNPIPMPERRTLFERIKDIFR